MNIVEKYIHDKGQLLILVSGLPACGKLVLGKNISRDFKIKLIDQFDYYKKDYNVTATLPDGTELINWYTDDAIDWNKFNDDMNTLKKNGLVVVGISLPSDKIQSNVDYHIHLNLPKQLCIDRRKDFLEKNKEKYEEEYKLIGTQTEKLKMNQLVYPYYLESMKKSTINKFINMGEMSDDDVYDAAFDTLINFISKSVYGKQHDISHSEITTDTKTDTKNKDGTETTTSTSISATMELLDKPKYAYEDELDMVTKYSESDNDDNDGPIKFIEY